MKDLPTRQQDARPRPQATPASSDGGHSSLIPASVATSLPKPFYEDDSCTLYHGDCREILPSLDGVVVSDPPYNVGYSYRSYADRLTPSGYEELLSTMLRPPSVVIHYPEEMFLVANAIGQRPDEIVTWVYNSNHDRQSRLIAWFGLLPDLGAVRQPYKNPRDKRVRRLIAAGSTGRPTYDWWEIQQVKAGSSGKTKHPCQIPLELMRRVLRLTGGEAVIDPFAGSGTTLLAAKELGMRAVGIELDEWYCEIAAQRLSQDVLDLGTAA